MSREQKRHTAICFKFMRVRKPLLYNDYAEELRTRESVHCLMLAIQSPSGQADKKDRQHR